MIALAAVHSPLGLSVHAPARSYAQKIGRGRCAAVRCDLSSDERERGRTVLRDLLLQRAVQTQLYYNVEFKNDFEKAWLLRFASAKGSPPLIGNSHAIMNKVLHKHEALRGWEAFMLEMMGADDEVHEVHVVWGNRVGGGSPNNPYLQDRPASTSYLDKVEPSKIARKIQQIRESIALEWTKDLQLVRLQNDELQRSHASSVRADDGVDADKKLQYAIQPEQGGTSPLRQASFDLLMRALTRAALRAVVLEKDRDQLTRYSAEWLRAFDAAHSAPFGTTEWRVAEGFITTLMAEPLALSTSPGGQPRFLDPLQLADRLLELRADIADDWVDALEQVPSDHVELVRRRLDLQDLEKTFEKEAEE